ncbi:hypothetical protein [Cloacibacterium sp.]|uniref:hypothetical protein n=1 Tax=Cloacibacterium sp. TaxID=1913682 RepID=UPI0035AEAE90
MFAVVPPSAILGTLSVMAFERFDTKSTDPKNQKFANASQKLKEVQAGTQIRRYCTTFNFAPTLPSPPTTHFYLLKTFAFSIKMCKRQLMFLYICRLTLKHLNA